MNRLDKVIQQARGLVQLLESIAAEEEQLQVAEWDQHVEKESPQCTNCDAMLVGSRITSTREGLCNGCWENVFGYGMCTLPPFSKPGWSPNI